jgi:hypothetical protein
VPTTPTVAKDRDKMLDDELVASAGDPDKYSEGSGNPLVKMLRKRIALVKMRSANDTAQNAGNVTSHLASRAECTCDKNVIVRHKRTRRMRRRANLLYVSTAESRENLTTIYYDQIEFVRTNFSTYFEINDRQIQVVCNQSFAI